MSPSRWPRSPLPGKCSKRFCGSSRHCGRSHHQGQHETVRCHAFKSNRQKECVQMPGKMARSDPRPGVRVTRGAGSGQHLASVLQEGRENANIDAGLGFIWRISVLTGFAKWVGPWCSAFFPADRGPVRRRERAKLSLHRKVWIEYETLVRKKEIDLWCFC